MFDYYVLPADLYIRLQYHIYNQYYTNPFYNILYYKVDHYQFEFLSMQKNLHLYNY